MLEGHRACGDILVVAVNTGESIRIIKPWRRPVEPDVERIEITAALDAVDFVIPLADRTPSA